MCFQPYLKWIEFNFSLYLSNTLTVPAVYLQNIWKYKPQTLTRAHFCILDINSIINPTPSFYPVFKKYSTYIQCFIFLRQCNTNNCCKTRHTSCCILFNSLCIDFVKSSHKNKVHLWVREPILLFRSLLQITYKYFSVLSDECAHLCVFPWDSVREKKKKIGKTALSILSSTRKTGEFCFC